MNEGTDRGPGITTPGPSMECRSWRRCCHACAWCWPQILPMRVMLRWSAMMWCACAATSESCWWIVLLFYEATVRHLGLVSFKSSWHLMLLRCRWLPQPRGSKCRAHGVWVWQLCWEAPTIGLSIMWSCDQRKRSELFGAAGACSYTGLLPQSFQSEQSIRPSLFSLFSSSLFVFTGKCP